MRIGSAALVLSLFGAAHASAQTTTVCRADNGTTRCQSQPQGGVDWSLLRPQPDMTGSALDGYAAGVRMRQQRDRDAQLYAQGVAQIEALKAQQAADANQDALVKQAGELVSVGKCADAKSLALTAGNFGLAQQIADYCDKSGSKP